MEPSNTTPPWMRVAKAAIGTAEIPGAKHNPTVLGYLQRFAAWVRDDETPWCAAFVGWCLEEAGYISARSLAARSYLKWGEAAQSDGLVNPLARASAPRMPYGTIVVMERPGSSWAGHVGFYVGPMDMGRNPFLMAARGPHIYVLGGNQDNRVCVRAFELSRVIGWRWPVLARKYITYGAVDVPMTNIDIGRTEA